MQLPHGSDDCFLCWDVSLSPWGEWAAPARLAVARSGGHHAGEAYKASGPVET